MINAKMVFLIKMIGAINVMIKIKAIKDVLINMDVNIILKMSN
jgi:hypothetical protein